MNRNKLIKIFAVMLIAIMSIYTLTGCGSKNSGSSAKLKIVATTFPEYDWMRELLGDQAKDVDLKLLQKNGTDLHSYQPTADDLKDISESDIFIHVGGESDEWVEDALKNKKNKDMIVINLMDEMKDNKKAEEVKEGMQAEDEHEHDHKHDEAKKDDEHHHDHKHEDAKDEHEHNHEEGEVEYDEHVWLSVKNAIKLCQPLEKALETKDKDNADTYKKNLESYTKKLTDLDQKYTDAVSKAKTKTLLFGDRFPFRYMVDDYGLDYFAAFVGCSAESEASFETIHFLSSKLNTLGLKHVVTIENSDKKIAKAIIKDSGSTKCDIQTLDSLQSIKTKDIESGKKTYIKTMEKNLDVLKVLLEN